MTKKIVLSGIAIVVLAASAVLVMRGGLGSSTGSSASDPAAGQAVHTETSGDLEIALLSPTGTLRTGRAAFTIEFRTSSDRRLVNVGTVRASANMPMPGMVMPGNVQVTPTSVPGRYEATAEFGMAGAWQMGIEWDGPAGRGSVSFEGTVQ